MSASSRPPTISRSPPPPPCCSVGRSGWIDRESDPQDARAVLVRISPAGRAALAENRLAAGTALAPRLARLDDTQRQALAAGLAALRAVLADERDQARRGTP